MFIKADGRLLRDYMKNTERNLPTVSLEAI